MQPAEQNDFFQKHFKNPTKSQTFEQLCTYNDTICMQYKNKRVQCSEILLLPPMALLRIHFKHWEMYGRNMTIAKIT